MSSDGVLPSRGPAAGERPPSDGELPAASRPPARSSEPEVVLPSEGSVSATRTAPPPGPLPPPTAGGSAPDSGDRRERIRAATTAGGLQQLPEAFDDADGDWQVIRSENSFEVLYLDHEQHRHITPEMVQRHHGLLHAFWAGKLRTIDQGQGAARQQLIRKFAGPHGSDSLVRSYPGLLKKAYDRLAVPGGIESVVAELDAGRRARGEEELGKRLRGATLDGVLDPVETEALFRQAPELDLREAEIAAVLIRALPEAGLTPDEPQGDRSPDAWLRTVRWATPEQRKREQREAEERRERQQAEEAAARTARAFKFKKGEARDTLELMVLCDRYPGEAGGYLFAGYLEPWLRDVQLNTPLALQARSIQKEFREHPEAGLEAFIRAGCQQQEIPLPLDVRVEPGELDLGRHLVGVRTYGQVRLHADGQRYLWGSVEVDSTLPGLLVSGELRGRDVTIAVELNTLHVAPGSYRGTIVARVEGASPVPVSVHYEVLPVALRLEPRKLRFGRIPVDQPSTRTLRLWAHPAGGQVVGTAAITPATPGVTVTRSFEGGAVELQVIVNPAHTRAEKQVQTSVRLRTNVGEVEIPVSFKQRVARMAGEDELLEPRKPPSVIGWTLSFGIAAGMTMWLLGTLLADGSATNDGTLLFLLDRIAEALVGPGDPVAGWTILGFLFGGWVGCFLALRRGRKRIRQWGLAAVTLLIGIGLLGEGNGTGTQQSEFPITPFDVEVTAAGLNIRSAPNTGSAVLREVRRGTRLRVVGERNDWYRVAVDGRDTAWVSQSFVRRIGDAAPSVPRPTAGAPSGSAPAPADSRPAPSAGPVTDPPDELVRALRGLLSEGGLRSGRGEYSRASQAYTALLVEIERMTIDHPRSPQLLRLRQETGEAIRANWAACEMGAEQAVQRGDPPPTCG
jgi:hypothetical protein